MSTRLAELVLQKSAVTRDELEEALQAMATGRPERGIAEGDFLGRALVLLGYLSPRELVRLAATEAGKRGCIFLDGWAVDPVLAASIPQQKAADLGILPLIHLSGHLPFVLAAGPLPPPVREELRTLLKVDVDALPAPAEPLDLLIRDLYAALEGRSHRPSGLGEVLVREKLIARQRLAEAEQAARRERMSLAEHLVRENLVDDEQVYRMVAAAANAPFVAQPDITKLSLNLDLLRKAPPGYVRATRSMPFSLDKNTLTVLTIDPSQDVGALAITVGGARNIKRVVTSYAAFAWAFKTAYAERLSQWAPEEAQPKRGTQPLVNAKFREAIVKARYLFETEYDRLRNANNGDDLAVLDVLHREELVAKDTLGKMWGDTLGVAYLNLDRTMIQEDVVRLLPEEFARANKVLLLYDFFGTVTATMTRPDALLASRIESMVGKKVEAVFSLPAEVQAALDLFYQSQSVLQELAGKLAIFDVAGDGSVDLEQLRESAGTEAVISFAEGLLLLAVKERASDIHIEPAEGAVRIRFRIDGHLQERFNLRRNVLPPLLSRLKILAGADIIERRLPQDGRISVKLGDRLIDFRFSTTPTVHGEKAVMRVLGKLQQEPIPDLGELMFSKQNMEKLLRLLSQPNGICFVTGPTGSGKSMTLYSCLKHLNTIDTNIMTIEDPVEYRLDGINQIQINSEIGLDCERALRSFLRQDPDIILVGEIRDKETAKLACEAALTGHLVLATLHTNSATQAFTRLIEMGVDGYLVAPAVIGAMAQRLVRRICPQCAQEHELTADEMRQYFTWTGDKHVSFSQGRGCEHCRRTGFKGRLAIHEIMEVNDEIRALISRSAPISEIHRAAVASGFTPMHYDGMKKVLRGLTTLSEVSEAAIH